MPATETAQRAYRRRLNAIGDHEVMMRLSSDTIAILDKLKKRHGLRNRGQVLEQENSARELLKLVQQRRNVAQQ